MITVNGQQVLEGDGTWPFRLLVDGDDLVCESCLCTWFGGSDDAQDDGETACGYPTKGHPDLAGCALPMSGYHVPELDGSPVPHMPFGLFHDGEVNPAGPLVRVFCPATGMETTVPIIDLGPGDQASTPGKVHGIDLTQHSFAAIGVPLSEGIAQVRYRIIGGARFIGL